MSLFYLSFTDPEKPPGEKWLGAAIVNGASFEQALLNAWAHECNPGGEVLGTEIPYRYPHVKFHNRLLNRKDLDEMQAELATIYNIPESEMGYRDGEGNYLANRLTDS